VGVGPGEELPTLPHAAMTTPAESIRDVVRTSSKMRGHRWARMKTPDA
jgi:hypothetical protein